MAWADEGSGAVKAGTALLSGLLAAVVVGGSCRWSIAETAVGYPVIVAAEIEATVVPAPA